MCFDDRWEYELDWSAGVACAAASAVCSAVRGGSTFLSTLCGPHRARAWPCWPFILEELHPEEHSFVIDYLHTKLLDGEKRKR